MPEMEVSTYKPLPADTYHLLVKGCDEKLKKNPKNPDDKYLWWEFEVLDEAELQGKTFRWITSKKVGKGSPAYSLLLACGLEETEEDFRFNTDDLIGCTFYADVKVEARKDGKGMANTIAAFWSEDEFAKLAEKAVQRVSLKKPAGAGPANPLKKAETAEPEAEEAPVAAAAPAPAPAATPKATTVKKTGPLHFPAKN